MVFVGGSVAVSAKLAHAPFLVAEALRYAIAALLLTAFAMAVRHRVLSPRGTEWLWLGGVAGSGLVLFNVALVLGAPHAEPAVYGVAVACVPAVLAVAGPYLEQGRPTRAGITAAVVVTAGAALVEGFGHCDLVGALWAFTVFSCEAAFTLLAVPVLRRHGAIGVSVHATWLAAVTFAVLSLLFEGSAAVARLTATDLLSIAYLAVAVTAVAFILWYSSVRVLRPARAGLLAGVAPASAALAGLAIEGAVPGLGVWAGIAVVAAGLYMGLGGTLR